MNKDELNLEEPEDRLGMTPEQWVQFQAYRRAQSEQSESGVETRHLRANLRRTPTERLDKMTRTAVLLREVQNAGINAGLSRFSRRADSA